ncbi:hypothetical protein COV53_06710 [Candidatus Gottesmanbacteria bacterium CG11_big_fil_rev_8_21_14_0_20_37_11]|uniref:Uncharacterized protein n=1 Tax=Candidatus Gottesmanbacteria bacterium CG11_big_fil_rev_8_21_14_0_20_37_11 TaxID=1974575 RepID=A0A2H0NFU4_9BACT|nr:MAG: hypothetical protein COV53_06710 [Candidatus Gottesmanbacteria bacterium CG11_big_fil_rev_8_21_14_0_20_37_11]
MANDDLYQAFIDKLKKEKSGEEAGKFLADLFKFSSANLYYTIMTNLWDEDIDAINKITDDKKADEELKIRFKMRTGVTPQEFVIQLRDKVSQGYLFPKLTQSSQ